MPRGTVGLLEPDSSDQYTRSRQTSGRPSEVQSQQLQQQQQNSRQNSGRPSEIHTQPHNSRQNSGRPGVEPYSLARQVQQGGAVGGAAGGLSELGGVAGAGEDVETGGARVGFAVLPDLPAGEAGKKTLRTQSSLGRYKLDKEQK